MKSASVLVKPWATTCPIQEPPQPCKKWWYIYQCIIIYEKGDCVCTTTLLLLVKIFDGKLALGSGQRDSYTQYINTCFLCLYLMYCTKCTYIACSADSNNTSSLQNVLLTITKISVFFATLKSENCVLKIYISFAGFHFLLLTGGHTEAGCS